MKWILVPLIIGILILIIIVSVVRNAEYLSVLSGVGYFNSACRQYRHYYEVKNNKRPEKLRRSD